MKNYVGNGWEEFKFLFEIDYDIYNCLNRVYAVQPGDFMAIVTKGSGGSIKFSGTGGGISITSSGGGGGGGGPGSPPMTNMSAWYDAEDIMLSNGASVTSWTDKSGNGNDLSNYVYPLTTTAPVLDTSGTDFNGKKAVNFAHVGGNVIALMCQTTAGTTNIPAGSDAISLYAVFKPSLTGAYQFHPVVSVGQTNNRIISWGGVDANGANGYSSGSPNWLSLVDFPGAASDIFQANTNAKITSFIIGAGEQMQNSEFLVNGSTTGMTSNSNYAGTINLPTSGNTTQLVLGGLAGENYNMGYPQAIAYAYEGKIAEVILYKAKHTTQERDQTLAYLAAKYGISI